MTLLSADTVVKFSEVQTNLPSAGPGLRTEIFFYGCKRRCKGCINEWVMAQGLYHTKPVKEIANYIYELGNPNISISGGEPFDQVEGLMSLLYYIQKNFKGEADILLYTGNSLDDIDEYLPVISLVVRYLVTGEYIEKLAFKKVEDSFVGSSNQVVYALPFFKVLELDEFGRLK